MFKFKFVLLIAICLALAESKLTNDKLKMLSNSLQDFKVKLNSTLHKTALAFSSQSDFKKDVDSKWSKLQGALGVLSRRVINLQNDSDKWNLVETRLNELEKKQAENAQIQQNFNSNSQTSSTNTGNNLDIINETIKNNTKKIDLLEKRLKNIEKHFFEILKKFQNDPSNKDNKLSVLKANKMPEENQLVPLSKTKSLACASGFIKHKGSCYYYSNTTKGWNEARDDCISRNSDLVIINNQKELEYLHYEALTWEFWVGAKKDQNVNKWIDGVEISKADQWWCHGDQLKVNESCLYFLNKKSVCLSNASCNAAKSFICEYRL